MGLTLKTDNKPVTVVRKDGVSQSGKAYTMYSLMYPFKNANDEYENVFVNAQFRKGTDLANKTKINISNAFMTGNKVNRNGKLVVEPKIFVLDYEVVEGSQPAPAPNGDMDFMKIDADLDEGLPFN